VFINSKISVINLREYFDRKSFNEFVTLYNNTFTDSTEREDPTQWMERLKYDLSPPEPKTNLIIAKQNNSVIGGIIFEFYRNSKCGLLTYAAVDSNHRRKGIARLLHDKAISTLKDDATDINCSLSAVLAEAENPKMIYKINGGVSPTDRILILSHLNAKLIDIPYIQPQLKGGIDRCRHLMLLSFPINNSCHIDSIIVKNFLYEFYLALGVYNPLKDKDFLLMVNYLNLNEKILLKNLK